MRSSDFLNMVKDFTYRTLQDFSIWVKANIHPVMSSLHKMVKHTFKILQQIVNSSRPVHFRNFYCNKN